MKKDSLLKSSFWISASGFISRFLAVVYIIPWNIWIGAANKDFANATYAYIFLLWKRRQIRKSEKDIIIENPEPESLPGNINLGTMFKSAIPFLLVDTIMAFLQLFDQISFTLIYRNILHQGQTVIDTLFGMFGFQANKLIMVIVALAISVSASVIPALSSMITRRAETGKIRTLLKNIIEFTFFIILPATLGMIAISSPLWTLFNNQSRIGTQLLIVSCLEALTYSFFMILENVLQVTGHVKTSLWYLLWAYLIKIILQTPMTVMLGGFGPLVASTVAFLIMGYFAFRIINIQFHLVDRFIVKNVLKMTLDSSIMLIVVGIAVWLLSTVIPDNHKIGATIVMSLGAIIGVVIYGTLSYFDGSLKILKKIKNTEIY